MHRGAGSRMELSFFYHVDAPISGERACRQVALFKILKRYDKKLMTDEGKLHAVPDSFAEP
eukprot:3486165-Amphidinium_carterae.2